MSPIQFRCPGCQGLLEVDESYRGCQATCPTCGTQSTVSEITPVEPLRASVTEPRSAGPVSSPFLVNMPIYQKTDPYAITSFVCSIIGFVFGIFLVLPLILIIPGIIFGHVSLSVIKKSGGRLSGKGLAITGLVIGYLILFLLFLSISLFFVL